MVGYVLLAEKLMEAKKDLTARDVQARLCDALKDTDDYSYRYYLDHIGDAKSGTVYFMCDGDCYAASYTMTTGDGTSTCKIDFAGQRDVVPRTTYEEEAPEAAAADPEPAAESAAVDGGSNLKLVESITTVQPIKVVEARSTYEIKLIAPGAGSSAIYPREVLKRDGPKVFKAGTKVYLNHPTAAEEAARPEGDVSNLVGVFTEDAQYKDSHAKGEGLYAAIKVFADHSQQIEEKAPYVGMSIRAIGVAEKGKTEGGKPVLQRLLAAQSVDVVTQAGAGGMILTEAATAANADEGEAVTMTVEEAQKLIKESVGPLRDRALKQDAREQAGQLLESTALPQAARLRIIERSLEKLPLTEAGDIAVKEFRDVVVREAKAEGEYLATVTNSGSVVGMGSGPVQTLSPKKQKKALKEAKRAVKESRNVFVELGMDPAAAKIAANMEAR